MLVLLCVFEGVKDCEVAARTGDDRRTVAKWRRRFETNPTLEALADSTRSGAPKRISIREEAVVISLACQRPEKLKRLETRMTQDVIVEEAAARDVRMSRSSVQRILARADLHPDRNRYFLFTEKDRPEYEARRDAICTLYLQKLPEDELVVCFDEMSGKQVLKAPHPILAARPGGRPTLVEQNYVRLGSRSLAAVVRPDTGECIVKRMFARKKYRTAETIDILRSLLGAVPHRVVHLIWDNGSTHTSKEMKRFLTSPEAARLRVYYTPKHASWLNLAENFFSRLSRRYLGLRRFESLEAFDQHVLASIERLNAAAKPVRWTYDPRRKAA